MSERLHELQHQRALAQEQVAWLDREIARETGDKNPSQPVPVSAPANLQANLTSRPAYGTPPAPPNIEAEAARILAQYQIKGRSPQDEVKRGCILYFLAAMTLLICSLAGLMMWKYR